MPPEARTPKQRKQDTLDRLEHDVDVWVASADQEGGPYLMPLSFLWDGTGLLLSTAASNPTARNLEVSGTVRLGLGLTRDVVLIEGSVQTLASDEISQEVGDAFAVKTGFDPRRLRSPYLYFRVTPQRVQAWREVNELKDRDLMRDGEWLVQE
ncbi:pyridoxamine 5'-phosphate oxidase family protein [Nonomuraea sp. NPDC049152]|uniref:pyridoxamine 5'-phosphate oxidase family protein n=1 Tax=Nonomuraea sp. NPDC049152 TaxID=3154350 RepID=UPI0033E332E5